MINNVIIKQMEAYSERVWTLSLMIANESVRLGHDGKGIAIVAEETRRLAKDVKAGIDRAAFTKDDEYFESNADTFSKETLACTKNLFLLALNCSIEAVRVCNYRSIRDTVFQIYCDEIREIGISMAKLFTDDRLCQNLIIPEIQSQIKTTDTAIHLMQFTIGGTRIVENIRYVQEVFHCNEQQVEDGFIQIRHSKVPVIDLYEKLGIKKPLYMDYVRVYTDWSGENKEYAVLVDEFGSNTVFLSKIGASVPSRSKLIPSKNIRDCWDSAEGEQFMFIDWNSL